MGLNDGIGLFYGGYEYERLPFQRIRASMRVFFIYLIIVTVALFAAVSFARDPTRQEIYQVLALSVPSICLQCIVLTVFLSVGKTGVYNVVNLLLKVLATVAYVLLLSFHLSRSEDVMLADFGVRIFVTEFVLYSGGGFYLERQSYQNRIREFLGEVQVWAEYNVCLNSGFFYASGWAHNCRMERIRLCIWTICFCYVNFTYHCYLYQHSRDGHFSLFKTVV